MQLSRLLSSLGLAITLVRAALPAPLHAQSAPASGSNEQITTFAQTYVAIAVAGEHVSAEMAEPKNKKDELQRELREKLRKQIAQILADHKLSEGEYEHLTFVISTDAEQRKAFDDAVAQIAGKKKTP